MTPEVQAAVAACGAAWFLIGVGLIRFTKDAKGWGVLMLAAGALLVTVGGTFK